MKKYACFCTTVLALSMFFISSPESAEKDAGGELAEVKKILHEARDAVAGLPDGVTKDLTINSIRQAYLKAGDVGGAVEIDRMFRGEPGPWDLVDVAVVQAKLGDRAGASKTFEEAVGAAGSVNHRQADAFREIAVAQVKVGDIAGALQTAAAVQDSGDKASVLREIAIAQASASDINAALRTAATIQDDIWKAYALRSIALAQANAADIKDAFQTAASIRRNSFRAKALRDIAVAQAKAGDRAGAIKTFNRLYESRPPSRTNH